LASDVVFGAESIDNEITLEWRMYGMRVSYGGWYGEEI